MEQLKVLVTRRLPGNAVSRLKELFEVDYHDSDSAIPRRLFLSRLRDKDGLVCLLTERIDAEALRAAPRLKAVATVSVGLDHVDLEACRKRGVSVSNTPGVLTETTADFAWALILAAARRVAEADSFVRKGKFKTWVPTLLLGSDVHGKTLGVVGFGRIGQAVARRALGFSMQVLYHDKNEVSEAATLNARRVSLDELLAQSDFVSINASLDAGGLHLIGARALSLMKPGAFLVNTARGPLVDEKALASALKSRRLAGAALDVYEREPRISPALLKLPNVVLAPHIASASIETRSRMAMMAVDGLVKALQRAITGKET